MAASPTEFSRARLLVRSLLHHWPHAPHERCASILLCGPTGNGKSHLIRSLFSPSSPHKPKQQPPGAPPSHTSSASPVVTSMASEGNGSGDGRAVVIVEPSLAEALTVRLGDGSTGLRRVLRREAQQQCLATTSVKDAKEGKTALSLLLVLDHLEFFLKGDGDLQHSALDGGAAGGDDDYGDAGGPRYPHTPHATFIADLHTVLRGAPPLFSAEEAAALGVRTVVFVSLFSSPLDELHLFARNHSFDTMIELTTPSEAERKLFFRAQCARMLRPLCDARDIDKGPTFGEALADALALRTGGLTYGGLVEVTDHASALCPMAPVPLMAASAVAQQAVHAFHSSGTVAVLEYRRSGGYVDVQETRWGDIAGMGPVKATLQRLVERSVQHRSDYARCGVRPSTGLLLHGPPGTGKTMLAKAMATELNASFVYLDLPELVQSEVGESERRLKNFFAVARERSPSVMFIDELQAAFSLRYSEGVGAPGSAHDARLVSHLLHLLDEAQADREHTVLFVGATNVVRLLDPLLLRAGRLDTIIEVPLPDEAARESLARNIVYGKWASWIDSSSADAQRAATQAQLAIKRELVRRSEGMSGAEMQNAASAFALRLLRSVVERVEASKEEAEPVLPESVRSSLFSELVIADIDQSGKVEERLCQEAVAIFEMTFQRRAQ